MSQGARQKLAAIVGSVLVATNLVLLTVVFPNHAPSGRHPKRPPAQTTTPGASVRAPVTAPAARAGTPSAPAGALRQAGRFAALYARYSARPLDRQGTTALRATVSLEVAQTLIGQPPLPAGGATTTLRPVGRARVAAQQPGAVAIDTTLARAGERFRLRSLVARERGRWVVVGFTFAGASVGQIGAGAGEGS